MYNSGSGHDGCSAPQLILRSPSGATSSPDRVLAKDRNPPDPGVRLAALNAGFVPHSRRSDAYGFTSQIDPQPTLGINSTDFG